MGFGEVISPESRALMMGLVPSQEETQEKKKRRRKPKNQTLAIENKLMFPEGMWVK